MTEQTPLAAHAATNDRTRYYERAASTIEYRLYIDRESFEAVCKLHRQTIGNASADADRARAREWIRYADFLLGFRPGPEPESRLLYEQATRAPEAVAAYYPPPLPESASTPLPACMKNGLESSAPCAEKTDPAGSVFLW